MLPQPSKDAMGRMAISGTRLLRSTRFIQFRCKIHGLLLCMESQRALRHASEIGKKTSCTFGKSDQGKQENEKTGLIGPILSDGGPDRSKP